MSDVTVPKRTPINLGMFFDTETTGIPDWKKPSGGDDQPHLVQIAAIVADLDTREVINTLDIVISPENWEIGQEVIDVHGITEEYARKVGYNEKLALDFFLTFWAGMKRFAYNTTYDNRIIRIGTKRYFDEGIQDTWRSGAYECQMQAARKFLGGKQPKLAAAYLAICGKELVNAHEAMADTRACMEIYFALQDKDIEAGDMFK